MFYLMQIFLFLRLFNSFNASNKDNTISIFHCILFIAILFKCSHKKTWDKNLRTSNIILDFAVWEILSEPVIKGWYNEYM